MLVLSRRRGESILIGEVEVVVINDGTGHVKLGISAPSDVKIWRAELAPACIDDAVQRPWVFRLGDLVGRFLDGESRRRHFKPAACEMEMEFLEDQKLHRSWIAQRVIELGWLVRLAGALLQCLTASATFERICVLLTRTKR